MTDADAEQLELLRRIAATLDDMNESLTALEHSIRDLPLVLAGVQPLPVEVVNRVQTDAT